MSILRTVAAVYLLHIVCAHMSVMPKTAKAGSRTVLGFTIAHDCGDDTVGTTNFTIVLPKETPLVSVTIQQNSWTPMITKRKLEPPVKIGSSTYNETVSHVTWIGFLPDGIYNTFNIRARMPMVKNKTLYFKGYQDCHNQGKSLAWATIPSKDNPNPRYPAVKVVVTEK